MPLPVGACRPSVSLSLFSPPHFIRPSYPCRNRACPHTHKPTSSFTFSWSSEEQTKRTVGAKEARLRRHRTVENDHESISQHVAGVDTHSGGCCADLRHDGGLHSMCVYFILQQICSVSRQICVADGRTRTFYFNGASVASTRLVVGVVANGPWNVDTVEV